MMNYVGSISILDRGEIHAQAIIDKNARSLAQRIADETKDELDKVMTRVENIYVSYEQSTQDMFSSHSANVEYIEDIKELEEILTDQIKKKKYQQQVTVFIVGFENLSNQRLKLIQQVNEFFMDATRPPDEEEPQAPSPDIDLEEVSQSIEDSLNSAEELADRLGELNKEMVDWLTNYAINKASSKGKKKLEKALGQAKDDLSALGDKLLKVQGEMEEKEEKVQQMVKQLEIKTQDVQKFRTAAEVAKKSLQDLEDSNNKAQAEVKVKDQILKDLRSKVQMLELEVGQSQYVSKMSSERMVEGKLELQSEEDLQKRMEDLQMQVDSNKSQMLEAQREWQKLHDQQVLALTTSHKQELEDLKAAFEEQMKGSKTEVEETKLRLQEAERIVLQAQEEADKARQELIELQLRGSSAHSKRQDADLSDDVQSHEHLNTKLKESRPSTKSSKQSTPAQKQRSGSVQSKAGTKSIVINQSPSKIQKETSDASVQDEGGDPISAHVETRQSKRARSTLETVQEADVNFDNIFDIKDHQAWSTVPTDQIPGRFVQYRKLTQSTLDEMEEKLHITITKTQRKVQTLKTQFQDHKSKWEAERKLLIEQVEQAQKLQNEAEKEADNAMTQLEEFINEQERLEEEEEEKRNDISKGISRPVTVRSSSEKKSQPSAPTEVKVVSPEPVGAEGSEQELKHLMQQTDDAKSERQRSESILSSADMDQDIAPWLLSTNTKSRRASSTSVSEEDTEESRRKSLSSKSTSRAKSERIRSNLSRHGDPVEEDEEDVDAFESDENKKSEPLSSRSRKSRSMSQRSLRGKSELDGAQTSLSVKSSASRSKSQDKESSQIGGQSRVSSRHRSGSQAEVLLEDFANKDGPVSRRGSRDHIEGEITDKSRTMSRKSTHEIVNEVSEDTSSRVSRRSSLDHQIQRRSSLDQSAPSRKSTRRSSLQEPLSSRKSTRQQSLHDPTGSRMSRDNTHGAEPLESRKGTMDSRMLTVEQDEVINLEGDDSYDDDFEDYDDVDQHQYTFDDKVISRSRSQPPDNLRSPGARRINGQPGRDSAPGEMGLERGSGEDHNRMSGSGSLTSAQAQEMARLTSGAMSAPPAVEPEAEVKEKEIRKLSPNTVSRSPRPSGITHANFKSHQYQQRLNDATIAIEEISETGSKSAKSQGSSQKEAWLTPRVTPAQGHVILSATPRHDDDHVLPPSQESAVHNIKSMLEEENLSNVQYRTLESVRSALQQLNEGPLLTDVQLERTLTIISLASQMTEESLQLGLLPDSLFDQLAEINSRAMSDLSHGEEDYRIDETPLPPVELLRPLTRDSLMSRDEPSSMMTFLQDWTFASLRSLPPLQGILTSSQSQRNAPRQNSGISFSKKPPSAPLTKQKSGLEKGQTFATMATRGSSLLESFSDLSSKHPSKVQFSLDASQMGGVSVDALPGGEDTELDIMLMESDVYLHRGVPVCNQGTITISKTQTEPELNKEATVTEEDVRMMSAASRASLRSQYKSRLEETRQAVEDRRSKSPAISVPSQRSLEEDQLVEEDDDDIPMPDEVRGQDEETDEVAEIGTSPPPPMRVETTEHVSSMSRKSGTTLVDHPVVKEYLKAYEGVQSFRDTLSKILLDKEMLQAGDIIQDLDMMKFDREGKVQLQLENMTKNVYYVLEEIVSVLGSIMIEEREPIVSSLTGMLASRDGTKNTLAGREKSADSGRGRTGTRASNQSFSGHMQLASASSEKLALKDLQAQYESLQGQLTEEARKHEEQLRHNTVVMMEMQDTINELQRELTALGRASSRMRPTSEAGSQQPESAVMFTRLDSERNAKIMKRAVNDRKLDTEKYKEAVSKMDDYVSLPAQRLCHLVRKYVHHCQMKEIEENVKKSKSLNENVFEILDKMEGLQNQRAKRWANKMDEMGSERMRLANLLMETLDSIEQESGIFLIKPMYSYRGREMKERYGGKLSRPLKPQRNLSPMREVSSYAPAPTPASNARGIARVQAFSQSHDPNHHQSQSRKDPVRPLEGDETGLMGSQALAYAGTSQRQTWNLNASQVRGETVEQHLNLMNTPRILELDINRMLIGQNTISTKLPSSGLSEDRLVNASQNNLRSYVTVNRPSAQPGLGQRPRSFTGIKDAPPSSPIPRSMATNSAGNKRVRMSDMDQSRALLTGTPPLPPISGRGRDSPGEEDGQEQTRSPPGSSMRMSPPHIQEIISPLK